MLPSPVVQHLLPLAWLRSDMRKLNCLLLLAVRAHQKPWCADPPQKDPASRAECAERRAGPRHVLWASVGGSCERLHRHTTQGWVCDKQWRRRYRDDPDASGRRRRLDNGHCGLADYSLGQALRINSAGQ